MAQAQVINNFIQKFDRQFGVTPNNVNNATSFVNNTGVEYVPKRVTGSGYGSLAFKDDELLSSTNQTFNTPTYPEETLNRTIPSKLVSTVSEEYQTNPKGKVFVSYKQNKQLVVNPLLTISDYITGDSDPRHYLKFFFPSRDTLFFYQDGLNYILKKQA